MNYTEDHGSPEFEMGLDDIRMTGLLWKINHDLLHPIGLALAVADCEGFDHPTERGVRLSVMIAVDGVWTFPPEMDQIGRDTFAGWYRGTAFPLMTERPADPCPDERYYRCPICGTCRPDAAVACLVCP